MRRLFTQARGLAASSFLSTPVTLRCAAMPTVAISPTPPKGPYPPHSRSPTDAAGVRVRGLEQKAQAPVHVPSPQNAREGRRRSSLPSPNSAPFAAAEVDEAQRADLWQFEREQLRQRQLSDMDQIMRLNKELTDSQTTVAQLRRALQVRLPPPRPTCAAHCPQTTPPVTRPTTQTLTCSQARTLTPHNPTNRLTPNMPPMVDLGIHEGSKIAQNALFQNTPLFPPFLLVSHWCHVVCMLGRLQPSCWCKVDQASKSRNNINKSQARLRWDNIQSQQVLPKFLMDDALEYEVESHKV